MASIDSVASQESEDRSKQGPSTLSSIIFYFLLFFAALSASHCAMGLVRFVREWWQHRNDVPPPPPKTVEERKQDLVELFSLLKLTRTVDDEDDDVELGLMNNKDDDDDEQEGHFSAIQSTGTIMEASERENEELKRNLSDSESDDDSRDLMDTPSIFRRVKKNTEPQGSETDCDIESGAGCKEKCGCQTDESEDTTDTLPNQSIDQEGGRSIDSISDDDVAHSTTRIISMEGGIDCQKEPKPASPIERIETAKTMDTYDDDDTQAVCAICLEPYTNGDVVVHSNNPKCSHEFHRDCVLDYFCKFEDDTTPCPFCRQTFCYVAGKEEKEGESNETNSVDIISLE